MDPFALRHLQKEPTPFFVFDLNRVLENYVTLSEAFGTDRVYYAVKANNQPTLLLALKDIGARFEVGSMGEVELLRQLGVSTADIIFSAPVKPEKDIALAHAFGVDLFAFDSDTELEKMARHAPGSRVLVRIEVPSTGSMFPLNAKFGVRPEEAPALLEKAHVLGLIPHGIAFHVGSQCERKETWIEAMEIAFGLWEEARGLELSMLDIGGGFPVAYRDNVIGVEELAGEIKAAFASFPKGVKLALEPGRAVVADAGVLVASVIGMAEREDRNWLYLDAGALHGLFEAAQAGRTFPYKVITDRYEAASRHYVLTGPTCDPDDTILEDVYLPEMAVGDRVAIINTGAYSLVYSTGFGGFSPPKAHFVLGTTEKVGSV